MDIERIGLRKAPAGLIAANLIIAIVCLLKGLYGHGADAVGWIHLGAAYGAKISHGQWWRILLPVFLQPSPSQLVLNLLLLLQASRAMRFLDNIQFTAVFLIAGAAGVLSQVVIHPFAVGVCGSLGVIGLYASLLTFCFMRKNWKPLLDDKLTLLALFVMVVLNGLQLYHGRTMAGAGAALLVGAGLGIARSLRAQLNFEGVSGVLFVAVFVCVFFVPQTPDLAAATDSVRKTLAELNQGSQKLRALPAPKTAAQAQERVELFRTQIVEPGDRVGTEIENAIHSPKFPIGVFGPGLQRSHDLFLARIHLEFMEVQQEQKYIGILEQFEGHKIDADQFAAAIASDLLPAVQQSNKTYEKVLEVNGLKKNQRLKLMKSVVALEVLLGSRLEKIVATQIQKGLESDCRGYFTILKQPAPSEADILKAGKFASEEMQKRIAGYHAQRDKVAAVRGIRVPLIDKQIAIYELTAVSLQAQSVEELSQIRFRQLSARLADKRTKMVDVRKFVDTALIPLYAPLKGAVVRMVASQAHPAPNGATPIAELRLARYQSLLNLLEATGSKNPNDLQTSLQTWKQLDESKNANWLKTKVELIQKLALQQ